jgi:polyhydroxyalkanoate synthesis repressor PhaR
MPVIKRYSNRKLYNPETRSYVTLDGIGDLIRTGEDVQVVDHASGADLTVVTLAQIILEQEKKIGGMLPGMIFTRLIQARDSALTNLREAAHAFRNPDTYLEEEIQRRIRLLVDDLLLSPEEGERIESLLNDPRFNRAPHEEPPAADESTVQDLMRQTEQIEQEIERIKNSGR